MGIGSEWEGCGIVLCNFTCPVTENIPCHGSGDEGFRSEAQYYINHRRVPSLQKHSDSVKGRQLIGRYQAICEKVKQLSSDSKQAVSVEEVVVPHKTLKDRLQYLLNEESNDREEKEVCLTSLHRLFQLQVKEALTSSGREDFIQVQQAAILENSHRLGGLLFKKNIYHSCNQMTKASYKEEDTGTIQLNLCSLVNHSMNTTTKNQKNPSRRECSVFQESL
ncbi:hypothetical protein chiPu_0006560 [Chiloscyllium punctatum]|uniref:Uncharacterized protein n=1 Tax=Chiloscyllium punctatum TaxID=137246 RepID=A0A401SCR1_CHIPU|nr:hypothetical protein [Chiloscyllium punctatum]